MESGKFLVIESTALMSRTWSPYQLAVFRDIESGKGHTFVGAVAGSGKSTTIVEGLNYIPEGLKALFCTFSSDATDALREKLGPELLKRVDCSTLHSYGARQVRRAFSRSELNKNKTWVLLQEIFPGQDLKKIDREVQAGLVKCVSLAKGTLSETAEQIDELIWSFQIETGEDSAVGEDVEHKRAKIRTWFIRTVMKLLHRSAEATDMHDFDDMIWLPVKKNLRVWQYDRIFIDEVQDLNACQIELALRACKSSGRILAVGDERQAIYGFRGADENAVSNLVDRMRAKRLLLSVCYRCPKSVIREAQRFVPQIEWGPNAEEGAVTTTTDDYMLAHVQPGDFILSRANAPLVSLCLGFLAKGRKALVTGRDVGKNLATLIEKSKATDVRTFLVWLDDWAMRETSHLSERTPPLEEQIQMVQDKSDCLKVLCEGAQSLNEVSAKIAALFADKGKNQKDFAPDTIVLSTVHRAKGLERQNVWMLRETFLRGQGSIEEENIYYVAVTRAQANLYMVYERSK